MFSDYTVVTLLCSQYVGADSVDMTQEMQQPMSRWGLTGFSFKREVLIMTYEDDIKRVLVRDGDGMMSLHTGSRYCDVPIETELIRTERVEITYEEALDYVKHNLGESDAIKSKVKELIVEAMEKQIPKKPSHFRYKPKQGFPKCPCCNTFGIVSDKVETCGSLGKSVIYGGIKNAYCTECGQAIDWANMEEVQI